MPRWPPSASQTSASQTSLPQLLPLHQAGAAAAQQRPAHRVLGERDEDSSDDDDDASVPFATWFCPSCTLENAKANTACEACGAVRAPTPRERRMSRERAAEAEARRNSEALARRGRADLSDLSDGDDATVVEARPTARRRVRAGRPLLLALPPELARRARIYTLV